VRSYGLLQGRQHGAEGRRDVMMALWSPLFCPCANPATTSFTVTGCVKMHENRWFENEVSKKLNEADIEQGN